MVSEPWGCSQGWAGGEEGVGCSVKIEGVAGRGESAGDVPSAKGQSSSFVVVFGKCLS